MSQAPSVNPGPPERRQRARNGPSSQALFFSVPGVQLCLPLEHVHKVLPMLEFHEVPDAPPHVAGLINLGGEVVPAVDLGLLLKREAFAYTVDTPVLLCESRGRLCGVIVHSVSGVARIENSQRRMGEVVRDGKAPFLTVFEGHPGGEGGLVFMLDLDTVCEGLQVDLAHAVAPA